MVHWKEETRRFFLKNFEVGGISPGMGSLFPLFEYRGPRWIVVDLFQDILEKSTIIIFLHILNSYNNLIFLLYNFRLCPMQMKMLTSILSSYLAAAV